MKFMSDPDLEAMAKDELSRAMTLTWRDLSKVIPWGDTFEGISPGGRDVEVERNYLWATDPAATFCARSPSMAARPATTRAPRFAA
jgi:hypothetical protein